jgi:hypothetical protein
LDVIRQSILNAGPRLTQASFDTGIEQIQNMQLPEYRSVSFGPNRREGAATWQSAEFNKSRWQPSNDLIKKIGPYEPFWSLSYWTGQ